MNKNHFCVRHKDKWIHNQHFELLFLQTNVCDTHFYFAWKESTHKNRN